MYRLAPIVLLLVGIAAVFGISKQSSLRSFNSPLIDLDICSGIAIENSEPLQQTLRSFTVYNYSDSKIPFTLTTSCGCVAAEPKEGVLDPKGNTLISLKITAGERGVRRSGTIGMAFRMPNGEDYHRQVSISVASPPLVDFQEVTFRLGRIRPGETIQKDISLQRSLVPVADLSIHTGNQLLEVIQWKQESTSVLSIQTRSDLPVGEYTERVRFVSKSRPELQSELLFHLEVTEDFRCTPSILSCTKADLLKGVQLPIQYEKTISCSNR